MKLVVGCFRIDIALVIFQPYRDMEAGDNQPLRKVPIPIYRCHICAQYVTYNFYRGIIGGGIGGYRYRGIIGE